MIFMDTIRFYFNTVFLSNTTILQDGGGGAESDMGTY